MRRRAGASRTGISAAAVLALTLFLASCGGASKPRARAGSPGTDVRAGDPTQPQLAPAREAVAPDTVIAKVGGASITWAALEHQMAIGTSMKREVPQPPAFTSCISRLRTFPAKRSHSGNVLKRECARRYQELLEPALSTLIHARWLTGEAADRHLAVDRREVEAELAGATSSEARSEIAKTGQTLRDIKSNALLSAVSNALYDNVSRRTPRVTSARVAAYYARHKKTYFIPELRDIHIIRTATDAAAKRVRAEIEAGRSFAAVASRIKLPQPINTKEGTLHALRSKFFSEPVLNDAIFRAPPRALQGPVRIELGFYVFEVIRVIPPHQRTLSQVAPELERQLPGELHQAVLAREVSAFRRKWTARTHCRAGFVVQDCAEYRASTSSRALDPYTF